MTENEFHCSIFVSSWFLQFQVYYWLATFRAFSWLDSDGMVIILKLKKIGIWFVLRENILHCAYFPAMILEFKISWFQRFLCSNLSIFSLFYSDIWSADNHYSFFIMFSQNHVCFHFFYCKVCVRVTGGGILRFFRQSYHELPYWFYKKKQ